MKVAIINLGCKVNQCECDSIAERFKKDGFEVAQEFCPADVYVINTCAVTQEAEKKSRQCVARVRKYNPEGKVYVIGCASQKNPDQFDNKGVTYIGGNAAKMAVCDLPVGVDVKPLPTKFETMDLGYGSHAREVVKIEDGCNNFCTYCIVPYLRGRVRSRSIDDILCECRLRALSCREIVLTGINTSAWGEDIGYKLSDLVKALKDVPARFRFGSLEVNVVDAKLLRAMKDGGNFCDHFHLSLQSGDDGTLKDMNRHYTSAQFAEKVRLIRDYFPQAAITTDIIVGFATETDERFDNSLAFARSIRFANIHVFPYSRRAGTKAYPLPPVDPQVVSERVKRMTALKNELIDDYLHSNIGYRLQAVMETEDDLFVVGHTVNYIKIYLPRSSSVKIGEMYEVVGTEIYKDGLLGKRV